MTMGRTILAALASLIGCAHVDDDDAPVMPALELPAATEVVTGPRHTCSLHEGGNVWCWGAGRDGQLGTGVAASRARPTPVVDLDDAEQLAVGDAFSCARRRDDRVMCWGRGDAGQLGDHTGHLPDTMSLMPGPTQMRLGPRGSLVPVEITRAAGARLIVAAGEHACALQRSGRVWCWGSLGGTVLADTSGNGVDFVALYGARALQTDRDRVCGEVDGQWRCWGRRAIERQACDGMPGCGLELWIDEGRSDARQAGAHTCVVDGRGRVACHGANHHGQLGMGDLGEVQTPTPVLGYWRGRWK